MAEISNYFRESSETFYKQDNSRFQDDKAAYSSQQAVL